MKIQCTQEYLNTAKFKSFKFAIALFLLFGSLPVFSQLQVYTDRATWEAALSGLVNEDLESVAADVDLKITQTTVGSHTFTGSGSGTVLLDVPPLSGISLFPNTVQISMNGTTGGTPKTTVSIPTSYGIAFDWKTSAGSSGLHNSLYLTVTGTSGSLTRLLNPFPNVPQTGFIGIISPCGGITSYQAYSTRANFQNFSLDNFSYATNLASGGLPEIDVLGNSLSIADGDNTPSLTDHTDFGSTNVAGGTVVRTFTIQNTGLSNLTVSSIVKSGAHMIDYTIGALSPASPIPAGMSATFNVTFDPSAGGTRSAAIKVNNSDCNEGVYDYAIVGTGVLCSDTDGDGVCDEEDNCSETPNANQADSDGDGVGDACDLCPEDENKTEPGDCGCGVADTDTDGDGTADCNDGCPEDANKIAPGICGCGVSDVDTDGDGTADCNDGCPNDANKIAPGQCGCGVADTDTDGDGTADCNDGCPEDANKIAPGQCGCGIADTDTDGDGIADCNDACDNDPDNDADGDGVCGDVDNCPNNANANQADLDQDGIGDVCDATLSVCDALDAMIEAIQNSNISSNLKNALITKLNQAKTKYANGNNNGAIGSLNGFIGQVQGQSGNGIPTALANEWIANAQAVIAAIESGNSNCTNNGGRPAGGGQGIIKVVSHRGVSLFPNPATDVVKVDLNDIPTATVITIADQFGKTVLTQSVEQGLTEIVLNLSGNRFPGGVYFVSILCEDQRLTQRLMIAK